MSSSQSNDKIEKEIDLMLEKESAFIFLKHGKEFNIEQSERTIHLIYEIISKKNYQKISNRSNINLLNTKSKVIL